MRPYTYAATWDARLRTQHCTAQLPPCTHAMQAHAQTHSDSYVPSRHQLTSLYHRHTRRRPAAVRVRSGSPRSARPSASKVLSCAQTQVESSSTHDPFSAKALCRRTLVFLAVRRPSRARLSPWRSARRLTGGRGRDCLVDPGRRGTGRVGQATPLPPTPRAWTLDPPSCRCGDVTCASRCTSAKDATHMHAIS